MRLGSIHALTDPKENMDDLWHFQQIRNDINRVSNGSYNWDDPRFTWEKAHLCSVMSLLAYSHIPEFEIENAKRAKLIPCDKYREIFESQNFETASALTSRLDLPPMSVRFISRSRVVVAMFRHIDVVFIALRGTIPCYADIKTDLSFFRCRVPGDRTSLVKMHTGFFNAVASVLEEVLRELVDLLEGNIVPIYITGHSLGGAMAAILNTQLRAYSAWRFLPPHSRNTIYFPHPNSCYTYGMPRYGNTYSMSQLATPFHVYNERDLVPSLPPTLFGYADAHDEYCLDSAIKLFRPHNKGNAGIRFVGFNPVILGSAEHRMEKYIERCESAKKNGLG